MNRVRAQKVLPLRLRLVRWTYRLPLELCDVWLRRRLLSNERASAPASRRARGRALAAERKERSHRKLLRLARALFRLLLASLLQQKLSSLRLRAQAWQARALPQQERQGQ